MTEFAAVHPAPWHETDPISTECSMRVLVRSHTTLRRPSLRKRQLLRESWWPRNRERHSGLRSAGQWQSRSCPPRCSSDEPGPADRRRGLTPVATKLRDGSLATAVFNGDAACTQANAYSRADEVTCCDVPGPGTSTWSRAIAIPECSSSLR
jgi:hypothetical protein